MLGAQAPAAPAAPASPEAQLRTFEIARPAEPGAAATRPAALVQPSRLPSARDALRTSVGLGYVQGADWGSELIAGGGFAGAQVQADALITRGSKGLVLDHGSLMVYDPEARWRAEAGDLFSNLRGAAIGGRVSWAGRFGRRPAIAVYGPHRGADTRATVIAYRDQLVVKEQTLLDAEVASDRSWLLRSRLTFPRLEVETTYRTQTQPLRHEDGSVSASLRVAGGLVVSASAFRTFAGHDPADWNSVAVRLPLGRHLDVTI